MAAYRIIRHPLVRDDLLDIVQLIAEYSGRVVADRKLSEIEATVRSLADFPHKGTLRDEIFPGLRAIPAGRKGVVSFFVNDVERTVEIISITYAGAEWSLRVKRRQIKDI